ncbi:MAG TPA: HAD family hydrolase [Candidatus Eremiobacteraceae bacterium]
MTAAERRGVEAVLFDFDHTLGVDHKLEETVLLELSQRYCATPLTGEQIGAALALFRSGIVRLADMIRTTFAGCSCGADIVDLYKSLALDLVPARLEPMPGAARTIAALKARGLAVAILSNGWSELQMAKAAAIGFDGSVYVSESIGAWKPDARAFEIATQGLDVSPRRSMYVGDSPLTDVVGAKRAGMFAVWADLEGQTYPQGVTAPDFAITSLDQVVDLACV